VDPTAGLDAEVRGKILCLCRGSNPFRPARNQTIKKNTETLIDASKEAGLEANPEKTKYMLVSRSQKIGQKHSIKIVNRFSEDVAKFKYLGTTLTHQNYTHEEIKSRLNSGNACYHSVHSSVLPPAV
jgi:hypothetical protein